jgi:hypothetical protein
MQDDICLCPTFTKEEALEFEMLDALPPTDDYGFIGWIFEGEPTTQREKRWLELYTKLVASQEQALLSHGVSLTAELKAA